MADESPRTDTQVSPDDVGRRLSDPDDGAASHADTEDVILAAFIREYDAAANRVEVLQKYLARYPRFAGRIDSLARAHALAGAACASASPPPAPRTLQPGDRLGDFTIVRLIASGGMGEVYEARQARLNRTVAVKVIRRGRISPEARERFDREQQTLARLHQTHIVPIHTSGEDGEVQFFAMAYIPGAALNRVVQTAYDRETAGPQGSTPELRELAADVVPGAAVESSTRAGRPTQRDPDVRLFLSADYFRSVAEVMVQAAEAVQHAHDARILHRDIKPSNLMVDPEGHCWIIDFGLAGHLTRDAEADTEADATALTYGAMGTPQYMAPEQYEQKPEYRSDVWALGATLYELLTLRRAFDGPTRDEITAKVLNTDPRPVRDLVPTVPRDLAAICRKALQKKPAKRYQAAADFAADVRRWLNREPVTARPAGAFRRAALWANRNPGWAVALTCTIVAAVAVGVMGYRTAENETKRATAEANAAKADADAADARAKSADERADRVERERQFEQALLAAEGIRNGPPRVGWSSEALDRLKEALRIHPDASLRDHAAATLVGLDARYAAPPYHVGKPDRAAVVGLSSVVFGPSGTIVAGGYRHSPALLWDENLARAPSESKQPGAGPVAFADADTPLQLVLPTRDRWNLLLWNVATNEKVTDIPLPRPTEPVVDVTAALSADVRLAAASVTSEDKDGKRTGVTLLWAFEPKNPGAAARELARWDQPASALAFSPDGKHVAAGTRDGMVSVRTTPDGAEVLALGSDLPVKALAFGRNFRRTAREKTRLVTGGVPGWHLAVGTMGGTTTLWDLETKALVNVLRGGSHYVNAVAFSPDGSSVVTTGHVRAILWDVATGKPVLNLLNEVQGNKRPYQTGVDISPDGRRVAITSSNVLGDEDGKQAGLDVLALDDDRGIRTYRGLSVPVQHVWLSASRKWVAALAQNWHLGVWERETGRLKYIWDMPVVGTADSTDLAFDEKEESVLIAGGERATRLNLSTGERTGSWSFPRGLMDNLVVRPGKAPLLFRWEQDGLAALGRPLARELLSDGTSRKVFDPLAIPGKVHTGNVFAGGKYLIVFTKTGTDLYEFDGTTVKRVPLPPGIPVKKPEPVFVTSDGKLLVVRGEVGEQWATCVYSLPDMTPRAFHPGAALPTIDDAGKLSVLCPTAEFLGLSLFRVGENKSLVTFDIGRQVSSHPRWMTGDGRYVFWGRVDGTVCVADVNRCLEQLAPFLGQ